MKTLLTTTALAALLTVGPALAQSDTAPTATDQAPATIETAPDAGMTTAPPAATEDMAPDATVPDVAPDRNLSGTDTMAPDANTDTMATDQDAIAPSVAATTTGDVYIGEQATEEDLASNWIGKTLYNGADENLGEINDILLDKNGSVRAVIVGVGGFLGIGQKDVAVNFDSIEPRTDEDGDVTLYLNATQDQLEAAPEFQTLAELDAARRANQPAAVDPAAPVADPALDPAAQPAPMQ